MAAKAKRLRLKGIVNEPSNNIYEGSGIFIHVNSPNKISRWRVLDEKILTERSGQLFAKK